MPNNSHFSPCEAARLRAILERLLFLSESDIHATHLQLTRIFCGHVRHNPGETMQVLEVQATIGTALLAAAGQDLFIEKIIAQCDAWMEQSEKEVQPC